tara:strand:- start:4075 stop:4896 length:822 start_codon:yes stop_codon:yes gene_type:complete
MSTIREKFDTSKPLPTILPNWSFNSNDNLIFDSLDQFVFAVSKITQKQDGYCDMTYEQALKKLVRKESDFPVEDQESIRNLVRNNLLKRGLITEEVYENFRYSTDGTNVGVDVGKYAAGEADCVITPSKQYVDFFYEMYISISYSSDVSNSRVRENVAKLLATVEELERKHIFIKINAILPINAAAHIDKGVRNFFSIIPLFSNKDFKSVETMSAVVNDRLLRKFYFAILEDFYGNNIAGGYGRPVSLDKTLNIGENLNEVDLFESIVKEVGA